MCRGICNANWKCVDAIASNREIKLQLGWTGKERRERRERREWRR
jgi:hypothetical protein